MLLRAKTYALKELAQTIPTQDWLELIHGSGEKGPLAYAWAVRRIRMPHDAIGLQWLLIRRSLDPEDENLSYYLSNAPSNTSLEDLASVALARHSIEQLLEQAKAELGLADYEVRSYPAWHRHMSLCMLAHSFLSLKQKKSLWPHWLKLSLADLRCLFNSFVPLPKPSQAFQLKCFFWRRKQRLAAITSRYRTFLDQPLFESFLTQLALPLALSP